MCFYHDDYDWTAQVIEEATEVDHELGIDCCECHRTIPPGTPYLHIHMEEKEDWLADFRDEETGDPLPGPWPDGEGPEEGETFDYVRCDKCSRLLEAIQRQEEEDGCSGQETRPGLEMLMDAMRQSNGEEYAERAKSMFPDLDLEHLRHMTGDDDGD